MEIHADSHGFSTNYPGICFCFGYKAPLTISAFMVIEIVTERVHLGTLLLLGSTLLLGWYCHFFL